MAFTRWMTLLMVLSVSVPPCAAAVEPTGQTGAATTPTAEEVVAAYHEAIGGMETMKAVRSKRMTYRVHMFGRDPYLMERTWTRPGRMKTGRPGGDTYTLTEGEKSWRVTPGGRQELPPEVAASMGRFADIDGPLVGWKKKGVILSYAGSIRYDMTELHHVTATFPGGSQWEFFFDARSGLLRKMTRPSFMMTGEGIRRGSDAHTYYYDYRSVGGVLQPHHWIQQAEEHTHLFVVESFEAG